MFINFIFQRNLNSLIIMIKKNQSKNCKREVKTYKILLFLKITENLTKKLFLK